MDTPVDVVCLFYVEIPLIFTHWDSLWCSQAPPVVSAVAPAPSLSCLADASCSVTGPPVLVSPLNSPESLNTLPSFLKSCLSVAPFKSLRPLPWSSICPFLPSSLFIPFIIIIIVSTGFAVSRTSHLKSRRPVAIWYTFLTQHSHQATSVSGGKSKLTMAHGHL